MKIYYVCHPWRGTVVAILFIWLKRSLAATFENSAAPLELEGWRWRMQSLTHSPTHAAAHSLTHSFIHGSHCRCRCHCTFHVNSVSQILHHCILSFFGLAASFCIPQYSCHPHAFIPPFCLHSFSLLQYFTRWLSCCMQSPKLPQFACIVHVALYAAPRPLACLLLASDLADTLRWTAVQCVEKLKWIWIFTFLTRNYDNSTKARRRWVWHTNRTTV